MDEILVNEIGLALECENTYMYKGGNLVARNSDKLFIGGFFMHTITLLDNISVLKFNRFNRVEYEKFLYRVLTLGSKNAIIFNQYDCIIHISEKQDRQRKQSRFIHVNICTPREIVAIPSMKGISFANDLDLDIIDLTEVNTKHLINSDNTNIFSGCKAKIKY